MDLEVKDVAELLNVSESTILKWLSDGKIPAYRLKEQYRFSKSEIEDWLVRYEQNVSPAILQPSSSNKGGIKQFCLYRAIHKGGVFSDIEGNVKEDVIRKATKLIVQGLQLDPDVIADLLIDREQMMPTALNHGIAVPHTRDITFDAHYDAIALVFPKKTIDYGALDGVPVHSMFFLFACDEKRHLNLLAKIAHFSRDPEALAFLQTKPKKPELLEFIKEWESRLS